MDTKPTDSQFDALADAARSVQNKVGEQNLWKAVMALPSWYFVAKGTGEEAEPMVAAVEGRPNLLAFTSEERAEAFTRHLEAKKGGPRAGVLEMNTPDAVAYAQQLGEANVDSVLFNNGQYSFTTSMLKLRDMYGRYAKR